MTTLAVAWAWLKKWWKWLLLPIGATLWLLGRATAKKTVLVSSPELQGHAELEQKVNAEVEQRKAQALAEKEKRDQAIEGGHAASMQKSRQVAQEKTEELRSDPIALTDYMKKVGRGVRQPKK